jgi:hypothetical protein
MCYECEVCIINGRPESTDYCLWQQSSVVGRCRVIDAGQVVSPESLCRLAMQTHTVSVASLCFSCA